MTKKKKKKKKISGAKSSAPASLAPSSSEASSGPESMTAVPAAPREKLEAKIEKLEQKIEDKKEKAAAKAREGFESVPDEEDSSIPPVVEDEFFAKGDEPPRVSAGMSGSFDAIPPDPHSMRKLSPEAKARRADLAKYVKGAVIVSAVILVAGFIKVKFIGTKHDDAPIKPVAAVQIQQPPAQTEPAIQQPQVQQPVDPPKEEVKTEEAKTEEAKTEEAKEEPKKEEPKKEEAKTEEAPKRTAAQEKALAQGAIDRGNAGAAAAAGERSVAQDPTDAEAWLILGAAYQMQGRAADAKRAFSTCAKQAKRGPIGECSSMLNQ